MTIHRTDKHQISRGSSVEIIERCAGFLRQGADFCGILDYADEESTGEYQELLNKLEVRALQIIARETGYGNEQD